MCLYAEHQYRCGCAQPALPPRLVEKCAASMDFEIGYNFGFGQRKPKRCQTRALSAEPYTIPWLCRTCYYQSRKDYEDRESREHGWDGWFTRRWYNSDDDSGILATCSRSGSSIDDPGYQALSMRALTTSSGSSPPTLRQHQSD